MKRIYLLGMTALLLGQIALADSTFVSGAVRGNWTEEGSPYVVEGNLFIEENTRLSIWSGVRVYFDGAYTLAVDDGAILEAIGAEGDSIVFTSRADSFRWAGIQSEHDSPEALVFAYCVFENATGEGRNGAVTCIVADIIVEHCAFRRNIGRDGQITNGAGLQIGTGSSGGYARIYECLFEENGAHNGGAIGLHRTEGVIERCTFRNNQAQSGGAAYGIRITMQINNCIFTENFSDYGGAIRLDSSASRIANCVFENNFASARGGAIYNWRGAQSPDTAMYEGNRFTANSSDSLGGAVSLEGQVLLRKNTFEENVAEKGGAIYLGRLSAMVVTQCTIVGNYASYTGSAIDFRDGPDGSELRFVNNVVAHNTGSPAARTPYCDGWRNNAFWGNEDLFDVDPCAQRHSIMYVNINGDSCDVDLNLYLDPLFVDWQGGDYSLSEESPLIDAGVSGLMFATINDPDGTLPDIGAFYFDQTVNAADEPRETVHSFSLSQNYPNPFNAETTIEFDVPTEARATLELFDITGRHIRTMFDDVANGRNSVHVSMDGMASGIYVYRLVTPGMQVSKKMLLLK